MGSAMEAAKEIWHKGSLGDEDDAGTSTFEYMLNTEKARDTTLDENASQHVMFVLVMALGNQPVCCSDGTL